MQAKAERRYSFPCSLDPLDIPPVNAKWSLEDGNLPPVTEQTFKCYASQKIEGSLGQQDKAIKMLQSRKIIVVKSLKVDSETMYVKL